MQNKIIQEIDPGSVMSEDLIVGDEGEINIQSFDNSYSEAEFLANLIQKQIGENIPLHEIAVLVSKQVDLYAKTLMDALTKRNIPYRNEQSLQDITTEPLARIIVDYLSCLYGKREPKAWERLNKQLIPFDDEEESANREDFYDFIKTQKKDLIAEVDTSKYSTKVSDFLKYIGKDILVAISSDYESETRRNEILQETKSRIDELLIIEPDLTKALLRFSDDLAIRILTIHKSKGLEFHSVIIMAIENEIFFGKLDEERCAFFVGVSRAKNRLLLTCADYRKRPEGYTNRWDEDRTVHEEFMRYVT